MDHTSAVKVLSVSGEISGENVYHRLNASASPVLTATYHSYGSLA